MEEKILKESKELRKLKEVLNLPEIRSGRISKDVPHSYLSTFKTGKMPHFDKNRYLLLKTELNKCSVQLKEFFSKEVIAKDDYMVKLLDILATPYINLSRIHKSIQVGEKPNLQYLSWGYYVPRKGFKIEPKGELVEKYKSFFEQLKFEMLLLASKIKI
ncbi:hypothetical protein ACILDU_11265 [Capnocytophaga canimorsus]|uniref:hypothetical protein n=1 Tax=Capnocytophaga canimorsus TaxID=28188 RepID=UPI0037D80205